jgi:CTP synthase
VSTRRTFCLSSAWGSSVSKTRYIFCTGGVVSSVGKGLTVASIGRILKARGLKVAIQKLDPYLNVDPGTMSPYQHGEVFVTADGAETDLDLGHYERFTDENVSRISSVTSGQVNSEVLEKERRGDYLGGTIQIVPHITNEIKRRITLVGAKTNADVVIVEVGGTVGDMEGEQFLEAIRQMRTGLRRKDTLYIHVTFLPYIGATGELKTKPTQHSVRDLRSRGIQPQVIIARADHPISKNMCEKIAMFCDVDPEAVIPMPTAESIYDVPLMLEDSGIAEYILDKLKLDAPEKPNLSEWRTLVNRMKAAQETVHIALVGKYVALRDAYMSVKESLIHAAIARQQKVEIHWINAEDLEKGKHFDELEHVHGILVPGGFGHRGIEGKILAARFAREREIPYFGLCLGMQVMCIEFARGVLELEDANSREFNETSSAPVISLMLDQQEVTDMGGTMRLGEYPCELLPHSKAAQCYQTDEVRERHRHRFEFNNEYRQMFEKAGMVFSGLSPDHVLVEIAEHKTHPFMVGTQFHPEFLSRPNRPHPLFVGFIDAAIAQRNRRKAPQKVAVPEN